MSSTTNGHAPMPVQALADLSTTPDVEEERVWLQGTIERREARVREIEAFLVVARQQLLKTTLELERLRRVQAVLLKDLGAPPMAPLDAVDVAAFPPPPPRYRPGQGAGYQTARYLLEVLQQRDVVSPGGALTLRLAQLACKGWHTSTIHAGLARLVKDGLVERVRPGTYALTDSGREEGPADSLPLREPIDRAAVAEVAR